MEIKQNIPQTVLNKKLIWLDKSNIKIKNLESDIIKLEFELFNLFNTKINTKKFKSHQIKNKKHQLSRLKTFRTQKHLNKIYNECFKLLNYYTTKEIKNEINIFESPLNSKSIYSKQKLENKIKNLKDNLIKIKLHENKCSKYDGLGYNPHNLKLYYKHPKSNQIYNTMNIQILETKIKKELKKYKYQLYNNFLYDKPIGE